MLVCGDDVLVCGDDVCWCVGMMCWCVCGDDVHLVCVGAYFSIWFAPQILLGQIHRNREPTHGTVYVCWHYINNLKSGSLNIS